MWYSELFVLRGVCNIARVTQCVTRMQRTTVRVRADTVKRLRRRKQVCNKRRTHVKNENVRLTSDPIAIRAKHTAAIDLHVRQDTTRLQQFASAQP
eukprot:2828275-Prymnesium_polylepis.1